MNNLEIVFIDLYEPELNISSGGESWEWFNKYKKGKEKYILISKKNFAKAQIKQQWLRKNDKEWCKKVSNNLSKAMKKSIQKRKSSGIFYSSLTDYCHRINSTQEHKDLVRKCALRDKRFQGKNNPMYGKHWVHNNYESLAVPENEIEFYLKNGYELGRKMKFTLK